MAWLELPLALALFLAVTRGVFWLLARPVTAVVDPAWRRALPRRPTSGLDLPATRVRPIEEVAGTVRRLGTLVHHPPRGASYAKYQGWCSAYDRALGEACHALGGEHLLGVLPTGAELDAERARVEALLWLAGMRLDEAA